MQKFAEVFEKSTMKNLYINNKGFKTYVDKYCKKYMEGRSITVEEALQHVIVKEYGEMCREEEKEK